MNKLKKITATITIMKDFLISEDCSHEETLSIIEDRYIDSTSDDFNGAIVAIEYEDVM